MMSTKFKDHFSQNSNQYAQYRPMYPAELVEHLKALCPDATTVLDCGCGTGQLSVLLSKKFEKVIAIDASESQIKAAELVDNISYQVASADQTGLKDYSVDLITVAQAAHWLDLQKFYVELRRIAKPQAIVALITYGVFHIDDPKIESVLQEFYYQQIFKYWPPERRMVEDGYQSIEFPFKEVQLPSLNIEVRWNLDALIGYIQTWSAVKESRKISQVDLVEELRKTLLKYWDDPGKEYKIWWPLSIRAGIVE